MNGRLVGGIVAGTVVGAAVGLLAAPRPILAAVAGLPVRRGINTRT